jgi:hypothetical protein
MNSFSKRLRNVLVGGNLTIADLGRIFGRSHSTVRTWVVDTQEPRLPPGDLKAIHVKLAELEHRIINRNGLPVPSMPASARRKYLLEL